MHDTGLFLELSAVFTLAVLLGGALTTVRFPPVLAYLLTGAILGPRALGLVDWDEGVHLLAEGGVALLLFAVGLKLPLRRLAQTWRPMLAAGGVQIALTTLLGAALAAVWGWSTAAAITAGFILALSSTAVVLELLEERSESSSLLGQLLVGVLILQDLAVVPMMLLIGAMAGPSTSALGITLTLAKALGMVVLVLALGRWLIPRLLHQAARTRRRELFLLAVLAIAGVVAVSTATAGLSLALGAFLAGIALAESDYVQQILGDLGPLRVAVSCLFFVAMGMLFDPGLVVDNPWLTLALVGSVLAIKLVTGVAGLLAAGLPLGNAAHGGLTLAQIGEFSFVLATVAAGAGVIDTRELGLFTVASVITMVLTPLALRLMPRSRSTWKVWRRVERRACLEGCPEDDTPTLEDRVLVAGFGHGGQILVDALEERGVAATIIETNPDTVVRERGRGRRVIYGDATDPEVLKNAGLGRAKALVVVISDHEAGHRTARAAASLRPELPVLLRTRWAQDELAASLPSTVLLVSEEAVGAREVTRQAVALLAERGAAK
jgi:CPA2 family monovalent cation:H+ antiporter-2